MPFSFIDFQRKSGPRYHPFLVSAAASSSACSRSNALIATTPDPESASIRRDEELTLEKLIARLPDKYREVLILREIEDMRYREIAAVTNSPMGTVMSRLARARSVLKEHWLLQANGAPHAVP